MVCSTQGGSLASSADPQVIEHRPGLAGAATTRPLKTGREFVIVLSAPRVFQLRWDRAEYDPGDPCKLALSGKNLGTGPLQFTVEAEASEGVWEVAATLEAQVDGDQVVAKWKFPAPADQAEAVAARDAARGEKVVSACRFEDGHDLSGSETAWMVAHAPGLDGALVEIVLEREQDGGWTSLGNALSTVKAGQAHAGIPLQDEENPTWR